MHLLTILSHSIHRMGVMQSLSPENDNNSFGTTAIVNVAQPNGCSNRVSDH